VFAAINTKINTSSNVWAAAAPRLATAAEELAGGGAAKNATASKFDPVAAQDAVNRGVTAKLATLRAKAAAAADAAANKTAAKAKHAVSVVVALTFDGADPGVPYSASGGRVGSIGSVLGRRRMQQAAPAPPPPVALAQGVLRADAWTPALSAVGEPTGLFSRRLVDADAVRDAVLSLVRSRWARDGVPPPQRVAATGAALDPVRGLYVVSLDWRGGGAHLEAVASALAAANDAAAVDTCASWVARSGFDLCAALDAASALKLVAASALATTAPRDAIAQRFALGRYINGFDVPSTAGAPSAPVVSLLKEANWTQNNMKVCGELDGCGAPSLPVPLRPLTHPVPSNPPGHVVLH
jgi:hypothetical protein